MNDEMCNFYIMFFYDSKKFTQEPPGMCRWGNLDDNVKFPKGSDQLDSADEEGKCLLPVSSYLILDFSSIMKRYVFLRLVGNCVLSRDV